MIRSETYREVCVCGIPYRMSIADGGVLFSNKSGLPGVNGRFIFAYRSSLWYLEHSVSTSDRVPCCHFVRMHELLEMHIGKDHAEADGSDFVLSFKS